MLLYVRVVKSVNTTVLISATSATEAKAHFKDRFQEETSECYGIGQLSATRTMLIVSDRSD